MVTWWLLPVSFPLALALGAVVAPPDAVAATSIARSVGLPRRVVTILEGESLVNDATAITCLRVAIAAIGGSFSVFDAGVGFLIALVGGVAIGLAVGMLAVLIRIRVRRPVYDTAISFMVPFAAYLPAEQLGYHELHGSGVISVVTAGLLLGPQVADHPERPEPAQRTGQLGHDPVPAREHRVPADRPAGPPDRGRHGRVAALGLARSPASAWPCWSRSSCCG